MGLSLFLFTLVTSDIFSKGPQSALSVPEGHIAQLQPVQAYAIIGIVSPC